jgi:RNA polymerase sigma-70 factor (ECF subfamily)
MNLPRLTSTDAELRTLASSAAAGNPDATRGLLAALGPRVLGVAQRLLGSSHPDLDDVAQESLLAVVKGLPRFRGESTLMHYATRITIRTGLHHQRRRRARARRDETASEGMKPGVTTPQEAVLASRRRDAVRELLESLPEDQAEALALQCVGELSLEEVAAVAGVSPNTIRSRVRLAKERIRKKIEKNPHYRELLT